MSATGPKTTRAMRRRRRFDFAGFSAAAAAAGPGGFAGMSPEGVTGSSTFALALTLAFMSSVSFRLLNRWGKLSSDMILQFPLHVPCQAWAADLSLYYRARCELF